MVRVNEDYVIHVDALNYTAAVDCHKIDKKGFPVYKTIGYYNDLKHAIRGIFNYKGKIVLSNGEKSLNEAIEALERIEKEFEEALQVVKEVER